MEYPLKSMMPNNFVGRGENMKKLLASLLCLVLLFPSSLATDHVFANESAEEQGESSVIAQQIIDMHKNSYQSLVGRITNRGYAETSLTGLYHGMFPRDASVQAMALSEFGDLDHSKELLNFLLTYNQEVGDGYMSHILKGFEDQAYGNTYLGYDPTGSEESYYQQSNNQDLLFMIKNGTNKAAQPFSVPFSAIEKVRVQLNNKVDGDRVVVRIMRDYQDETTEVSSKEVVLNGNQTDNSTVWREVTFDTPVNVYVNARYYLVVEQPAANGYIAWGGIRATGHFQAANYDSNTYNGWRNENCITAFEIVGSSNVKDTYYSSQTAASDRLYLINASNYAAAQPFKAGYSKVAGVKAYLEKTNDTDKVTVKLMEDYQDPSTVVVSTEYTFGANPNGWQNIRFEDVVTLDLNKTYYLFMQGSEDSGSIVWNGIRRADQYGARNYDLPAYNGWRDENNTTAFEIVYDVDLGKAQFAQEYISTTDGVLKGAYVTLEAEQAGGEIVGELKSSLDGALLAEATAAIEQGRKSYYLEFTNPLSINKAVPYYVELRTQNNDGTTYWVPDEAGERTNGTSYYKEEAWTQLNVTFGLNPVVSRKGILELGGDHTAVQEIGTLDSEAVTAIEIEIEKTATAAGHLIATLYKKTGSELQFVDRAEADITNKSLIDKVKFELGFPLKKIVDKSTNYVLEITAPDIEKGSVQWLGDSGADILETKQDGAVVTGEASYTAFKTEASTYSTLIQVDGNYSVVLSWARWVQAAKKDPDYEAKYKEWVVESYPLVADLANYFLETTDIVSQGGYDASKKLIYNPSIEHTRDTSYHKGYDLITNSFASQSLHEMVPIAAELGYASDAARWADVDASLVEGINDFLTIDMNGKTIYSEMYGSKMHEDVQFYYIKGFSWVNFGPLAVNWHGMDQEIMANTYSEYRRLGTVDYFGHAMLDACIFANEDYSALDISRGKDGTGTSKHVIGKGWSWELIYQNEIHNDERVDELLNFSIDLHPDNSVYTESWWLEGDGIHYSDPGNQEHASWQFYAISEIYPELTQRVSIDLTEYNELMDSIEAAAQEDYLAEGWSILQDKVAHARDVIAQDDLLQGEVTREIAELKQAFSALVREVDKSNLIDKIKEAEGIVADGYTKESYIALEAVITSAKGVRDDTNVTQNDVDNAINYLQKAINGLEKIVVVVVPPAIPSTETRTGNEKGTITLAPGQAGTVGLDAEIKLAIPNGATRNELRISIKKVIDTSSLTSDEDILLSSVFDVSSNLIGQLDTSAAITLSYDPDKLAEDQKVSIFFYDEEEKLWLEIGGAVAAGDNEITAEFDRLGTFAVFAVAVEVEVITEPAVFHDTANHWAEAAIARAVETGFVKGYEDGTFKPNATLTRAEFAVMIARAFDLQGESFLPEFTDEAEIGLWARNEVALAIEAGIIRGYTDGSFQPNKPINRSELVAMVVRAMQLDTGHTEATAFDDDGAIPSWAKGSINAAAERNLITGRGDNQFVPAGTATRAEAVTLLLRVLGMDK